MTIQGLYIEAQAMVELVNVPALAPNSIREWGLCRLSVTVLGVCLVVCPGVSNSVCTAVCISSSVCTGVCVSSRMPRCVSVCSQLWPGPASVTNDNVARSSYVALYFRCCCCCCVFSVPFFRLLLLQAAYPPDIYDPYQFVYSYVVSSASAKCVACHLCVAPF